MSALTTVSEIKVNIYTTFQCNPFNPFNILVWTKVVNWESKQPTEQPNLSDVPLQAFVFSVLSCKLCKCKHSKYIPSMFSVEHQQKS